MDKLKTLNDLKILETRLKFLKVLILSDNPDIQLIRRVKSRLILDIKEFIRIMEC
jgi:hypothetical protein